MAHDDMNHMQHIESVALSDCAILQTKEATYQGSWKRAGGRSAWFMARRNLDRLLTIMGRPLMPPYFNLKNVDDTIKALQKGKFVNISGEKNEHLYGANLPGSPSATVDLLKFLRNAYVAEDIFAMIAAEPSGKDGSVLAIMRDARRYFTLVEAEMIAEGVVEPESKTYEQETKVYCLPETDVYQVIADEKGMTRDEVKRRVHELFYSNPPPTNGGYAAEQAARHAKSFMAWHDKIGAKLAVGDVCTWKKSDNSIVEVKFVGVVDDKPLIEDPSNPSGNIIGEWKDLRRDSTKANRARVLDTPSCGDGAFDARAHRAETVSDGGSQHAGQNPLWPWQATMDEYAALKRRHGNLVDLFYSKRALDVYQLESVVDSKHLPKELNAAYHYAGGDKWTLKRVAVPAEISGNFPLLQLEKNTKEQEEGAKEFQFMYQYSDSDQKWKLRGEFADWGRDAG